MRKISLVGQRFGRLQVIEDVDSRNGVSYSKCICDCGKFVVVQNKKLKDGGTKSCGCHKKDLASALGKRTGIDNIKNAHGVAWENNKKHGMSNSRLYRIWSGMKQRCCNVGCDSYQYYGGNGVRVCAEWIDNFSNFMDWALSAGYNDNLTIDRIDSMGDYCSDNCRWISQEENSGRISRGLRYWCLDVADSAYLEFDNLDKFCRDHPDIAPSKTHIRDVIRGKVRQSKNIMFGKE